VPTTFTVLPDTFSQMYNNIKLFRKSLAEIEKVDYRGGESGESGESGERRKRERGRKGDGERRERGLRR
jgi:hypothetical protein